MSKTKQSDPPANQSQLPVETSGPHEAVAGELAVVVDHMKKSNGFVKQTNQELLKLNTGIVKLLRMMYIGALVGILLLVGLFYALYEQRGVHTLLEQNTTTQGDNVRRMNDIISKLEAAKKVAEDTKKAIDEQPTITVKPANTSDPTSKPVLVVQPKVKKPPKPKKGDPPPAPPPKPKGVEIPLDIPKKKK